MMSFGNFTQTGKSGVFQGNRGFPQRQEGREQTSSSMEGETKAVTMMYEARAFALACVDLLDDLLLLMNALYP